MLSHVQLFVTSWTAAHQNSLSITTSQSLLKLMPISSVMPSNYLLLCHPLLLLPSIFLSIRVLSNKSVIHIRWPKYWSFSFSISPTGEFSELISFRIDWLDVLAVLGTLKSLLQYHSSKATILQSLSFLYSPTLTSHMTTGKTIALTRWIFVDKVIGPKYLYEQPDNNKKKLIPIFLNLIKKLKQREHFQTHSLSLLFAWYQR